MNSEQVNALNRVLAHYGHDDVKHYREAGEPSGHIAQSLLVLNHYIQHCQAAPPPNGDYAPERPLGQAGPIGIVRDHPSHGEGEDSQGPSVVDRGSREIERRWAKEAIGLTAVELNEAYAQFNVTRDGCEIPSGHLNRASERLAEVMQRLGITGDEIPS